VAKALGRGRGEGLAVRALRLSWLAAALFFLTGCSGDKAEVSGTVRVGGEVVEEGSITFVPVEGTTGPAVGTFIKNGQYHVPRSKGVTVGKNRVELRGFKNTGRKAQGPTGAPGAQVEERVPAFPPEYSDRSTVVREVHPGANRIDFYVPAKGAGKE
jgi:hypothetical protein